MWWLLLLLMLAGCIDNHDSEIEEALKKWGMDVTVKDSTIYWEAPGESPYDIIYGIYITKGVCQYYEEECELVVMYGKEEIGRFNLAQ